MKRELLKNIESKELRGTTWRYVRSGTRGDKCNTWTIRFFSPSPFFFSLFEGGGGGRGDGDSSTAPVLVNNFLRFRRCGNELLRKFQVARWRISSSPSPFPSFLPSFLPFPFPYSLSLPRGNLFSRNSTYSCCTPTI